MSYLKLCQLVISNNDIINPVDYYIEDADGNVVLLIPPIPYPFSVNCEVIDWVSEDEFHKRGKINSRITEIVDSPTPNIDTTYIREYCFSQLVSKYPTLVK